MPKAFAADLPKQVHSLCITNKQRIKIIVHLENGTYRNLRPYHQDPYLFLGNYIEVKNIFILKKSILEI